MTREPEDVLPARNPRQEKKRRRRIIAAAAVMLLAPAVLASTLVIGNQGKLGATLRGSVTSIERGDSTFSLAPTVDAVRSAGCGQRSHAGSPSLSCPSGAPSVLPVLVRVQRSTRVEQCRRDTCVLGNFSELTPGERVEVRGSSASPAILATHVFIEETL